MCGKKWTNISHALQKVDMCSCYAKQKINLTFWEVDTPLHTVPQEGTTHWWGGPTLKWSEVHTLIYRGCPVGWGSPLNGGINKFSLHMDQLFIHFTCNEVNKTYAVTIKMKVHFIYFPSNCAFKLFARF